MVNAIEERISTRTFKDETLTKKEIDQIINEVKQYQKSVGPFQHSFELTFNLNDKKETNGKRVGTYGFIKDFPAYIGGVCENTVESLVDFGFVFELLILRLTELGYGTCWLGGTFKRKDYRRKLKENELIPAISPVGKRADKRSLIDRTIRSAAQSYNRKDVSKLFFDYNTKEPYDMNDEIIKQCLLLVQRGPSASNKQSWRLYIEDNLVHFYLRRTKGYAKPLKYDIQALDIGIALAHFSVGLDSFSVPYQYVSKTVDDIENEQYIITIQMK